MSLEQSLLFVIVLCQGVQGGPEEGERLVVRNALCANEDYICYHALILMPQAIFSPEAAQT